MKLLDRHQIDDLVRELEARAYGLARARTNGSSNADTLVTEGFTDVAPWFPRSRSLDDLRRRLDSRIHARTADLLEANGSKVPIATPVSDAFHTKIVDLVEEHQSVEPLGRRKLILGAVGVAAILVAASAFVWTRLDALASARPTIATLLPGANATEVPTSGNVFLNFGRTPSSKPSISFQPADGALADSAWDGKTLTVGYRGLRLATRYTLLVVADYRSRYQDLGHFEQRWTFTTEGYPVLTSVTPADGATMIARYGRIGIAFNHRPSVDPKFSLSNGTTLASGQWTGSEWIVDYSGLAPLTSYTATVDVDFGVPKANIHRAWTFSTEVGNPPPGTSVIWYTRDSPTRKVIGPVRLAAIDWDGHLVGTNYNAGAVTQSPDGSVMVTQGNGYVDASGRSIASAATYYPTVFADDGKSICELQSIGGADSGILWIFAGPMPGPLHRVALAGQLGGRSGLGISACSVLNDRVVVVYSDVTGIMGVKVFTLSSGRVVYQRSYAKPLLFNLVSSRDGRYLVEQTSRYDDQAQRYVGDALIRRTTDGVIVAHLPNEWIVQFSWDDSRVVTTSLNGPNNVNEIDLLDWQHGQVLWRQPLPVGVQGGPVYALAQPHGSKIAVAFGTNPTTGDVDQLWLVNGDGKATQVLNGVLYVLFRSFF